MVRIRPDSDPQPCQLGLQSMYLCSVVVVTPLSAFPSTVPTYLLIINGVVATLPNFFVAMAEDCYSFCNSSSDGIWSHCLGTLWEKREFLLTSSLGIHRFSGSSVALVVLVSWAMSNQSPILWSKVKTPHYLNGMVFNGMLMGCSIPLRDVSGKYCRVSNGMVTYHYIQRINESANCMLPTSH